MCTIPYEERATSAHATYLRSPPPVWSPCAARAMSSAAQDAQAAPAEDEALPPVPLEGLSLAALRAFAKKHAGSAHRPQPDAAEEPFEQMTTTAVCQAIVKPATLGTGAGGSNCTYAQLLLAQVCASSASSTRHVAAVAPLRPRASDATLGTFRAQPTRASRTWRAPRTSCPTPGSTRSTIC